MATINGTAGNDNLQGTPGDDVIYGAGGIDTIDAGAGDDVVNIIRGGSYAHWDYNNLIDGGTGYDVLDLSGWTKQLFVSIGYYAIVQVGEYDPVASPDLPGFTIAQARNFEEIRLGPLGANLSIFPEAVWETNPRGWKIVGGIGNDYIADGGGSDTIDLLGIGVAGSLGFANHVLTLNTAGGGLTLHFAGAYSLADFAFADDLQGGTLLTHS